VPAATPECSSSRPVRDHRARLPDQPGSTQRPWQYTHKAGSTARLTTPDPGHVPHTTTAASAGRPAVRQPHGRTGSTRLSRRSDRPTNANHRRRRNLQTSSVLTGAPPRRCSAQRSDCATLPLIAPSDSVGALRRPRPVRRRNAFWRARRIVRPDPPTPQIFPMLLPACAIRPSALASQPLVRTRLDRRR
jgi:hypothetical protein